MAWWSMEEDVVSVRTQQIMGADWMSSEEETAVPAVCCDYGFLKEKYQHGCSLWLWKQYSTWFMISLYEVLDGSVRASSRL